MSKAQSDCEQLLGVLMPFAEQMLTEHGEFFPFGATMSPAGECALAAAMDGEEDQPESADLIEMMMHQFCAGAKAGEYMATAIVFDALTVPPGKSDKQDTVICALDHRDDYSVKVCFPYSIDGDGELTVDDPFAVEGDYIVFGAN